MKRTMHKGIRVMREEEGKQKKQRQIGGVGRARGEKRGSGTNTQVEGTM